MAAGLLLITAAALLPLVAVCGGSAVHRERRSAAFNEPVCGTKSAKYPDRIDIRNGEIRGVKHSIVAGHEALEHSWPWMVYLFFIRHDGSYTYCGGTVLNKRWIITAAHCVDESYYDPAASKADAELMRKATRLHMGIHRRNVNTAFYGKPTPGEEDTEQRANVTRLVYHPHWPGMRHITSGFRPDNDLALLKLDRDLHWTEAVRPACLPEADDTFYDPEERVVLTGYGKLSDSQMGPAVLNEIVVHVVRKWGANSFALAYGPFGACSGDSGGPAHAYRKGKWYLAGVTSMVVGGYGGLCSGKGSTSVYVHTPSHMQWIRETIQT